MKRLKPIKTALVVLIPMVVLFSPQSFAQTQSEPPEFLKDLILLEPTKDEEEAKENQKKRKRRRSVDDIVNPLVYTVSRVPEPASEAPATIIVITRQDILERGYRRLADILQDLPSIDYIRPHAWYPWLTYWRGRRTNLGAQFLFMVDGLEWHDFLYDRELVDVVPLSSIERVEVIYGPRSVMFGARAITGTINVITRKNRGASGLEVTATSGLGVSSHEKPYQLAGPNFLADVGAFHQTPTSNYAVSMHYNSGVVPFTSSTDGSAARSSTDQNYIEYLHDLKLWSPETVSTFHDRGLLVDDRDLALDFRYAREGRLILDGELELGVTYLSTLRGRGLAFAADKFSPVMASEHDSSAFFLRHQGVAKRLRAETLVRFRHDELKLTDLLPNNGLPKVRFQDAASSGIEASYQVDWTLPAYLTKGDTLTLIGGIRHQTTARPFDFTKSVYSSVRDSNGVPELDLADHTSTAVSIRDQNITAWTYELYALSKYRLNEKHFFDVGFRTIFTEARSNQLPSLAARGSYIFKVSEDLTFKTSIGEALLEPSHRQKYMNFTVLPNKKLRPERALTVETGLNYQTENIHLFGNLFWMGESDVIASRTDTNTGTTQLKNLYRAEVVGLDLGVIGLQSVPTLGTVQFWAYASLVPWAIKTNNGEIDCSNTNRLAHLTYALTASPTNRQCNTGDIAPVKLWAGATAYPIDGIAINLLGRFVYERVTLYTNPVTSVASYQVLDANLTFQDLIFADLNLAIKVNNILGANYSHPGYSDAGAGESRGYWDDGTWIGSPRPHRSTIPQPNINYQLLLTYNFE